MITFANPRLRAEFDDWPSGSKRVKCVFQVHHGKRGWRVSRTTTGKPKFSTYSGQAAIVDGSDGRTYILQVAAGYGFVNVSRSDFMDATSEMGRPSGRGAAVFADGDDAELHKELCALILQGGAILQTAS